MAVRSFIIWVEAKGGSDAVRYLNIVYRASYPT